MSQQQNTAVKSGVENLREQVYAPLRGKRVGLMTNPSAVDRQLNSTYDILWQAAEVELVALFAPEHGFAGAVADGEQIHTQIDPRTQLPVYSLYGNRLRPTEDMLAQVDVLVCDIQDIGVRYYTFAWTISHILEAAGEHHIEVMILDRPNPLGGEQISGPGLDSALSSLVGRYPVPVIHGLTLGELAAYINAEHNPTPARLQVIPCLGWQRDMPWADCDLPWVAPSPNMPHISTVQHYPGACLVEGTNLSEGRGTTLPFEIVGAPWIDGHHLATVLNKADYPGVHFRPHQFRPTASKWMNEECGGVQVHITDAKRFQPIKTWLEVIRTIRQLYPSDFAWLPPHEGVYHFDRLIGSTSVRAQIEVGEDMPTICAGWETVRQDFQKQRQPYLLYS